MEPPGLSGWIRRSAKTLSAARDDSSRRGRLQERFAMASEFVLARWQRYSARTPTALQNQLCDSRVFDSIRGFRWIARWWRTDLTPRRPLAGSFRTSIAPGFFATPP